MKRFKVFYLALAFLLFAADKACSQTTNQWGKQVFGAQLSISVSNTIISVGSKELLHCIITNPSTNNVCFIQTDSRGMYEVILLDDLGQSIEINNPANVGDSSEKMGGVKYGENFECLVPLLFDDKIKAGHYRLVAKQKIYVIKNFDRKNMLRGELVSNPLDVQFK